MSIYSSCWSEFSGKLCLVFSRRVHAKISVRIVEFGQKNTTNLIWDIITELLRISEIIMNVTRIITELIRITAVS